MKMLMLVMFMSGTQPKPVASVPTPIIETGPSYLGINLQDECYDLLYSEERLRAAASDIAKMTDVAINAARCAGYIDGVADAHEFLAKLSNDTSRVWCTPKRGLSIGTRAFIILEYLKANPKMLRESARSVVILAHHESFPCPKKETK